MNYTPSPIPVLGLLEHEAAKKALKALRRHGEKSFQFQWARRSRWLNRS
jgi:hypothetical protein